MPAPASVALRLDDAALADRLAAGLRAAGYEVRCGTAVAAPSEAAVFDGGASPPAGAGLRIRLASRAPTPADADVVLLYGDLFGDGRLGAFRPALASLADPRAAFDADRLLAPLHPADLVDAIAAALRFGGRGVYDLAGPGSPASRWRARAAAVCAAYGWPVVGADAAAQAPLAPATPARAAAEWAWRPRRGFDATLSEFLRAAE